MAVARTDNRSVSNIDEVADDLWWLFLLQGIVAVFFWHSSDILARAYPYRTSVSV